LFAKWKGKPQQAFVEQVRAGHSLRALLRDDSEDNKFYDISLYLTGVKCPDYNQQTNYTEPFTYEAAFFVEHYTLNREVTVIFEAIDKRSFYGTVSYEGRILNEELLRNGLAQFVDWPKSGFKDKLKSR